MSKTPTMSDISKQMDIFNKKINSSNSIALLAKYPVPEYIKKNSNDDARTAIIYSWITMHEVIEKWLEEEIKIRTIKCKELYCIGDECKNADICQQLDEIRRGH